MRTRPNRRLAPSGAPATPDEATEPAGGPDERNPWAPNEEEEEPAGSAAGADSRRGGAHILHGDIHKGVLMVALPSVATMLLQTTNQFLDRFFIGKLEAGPEAQAAMTISNSLMFALMSAAMAISVGTTALVARSIGEGDIKQAEKATQQSLVLGALVALVIALPIWFARYPILAAMGLAESARDLAARYLGISVLGLPSLFLMLILNGTFRGLGDTVRPFWVTLCANAVHAGFNYLLIFGKFGFPELGLPGGAVALLLSQVVSVILYGIFLLRSPLRHLPVSVRLAVDWAKRIGKIGLPAAGQQLIRVGSMLAFQGLLARSGAGDAAVAALGVGLVSESIAFMPGFGYSIAASAFVGQNLGARQVDRANAGAWAATWQAIGVMTLMGVVFYVFAEPFARLFLPHIPGESVARAEQVEATVALVVAYLRVAAISEPFLGLGMVLTGALQGAGETVSPTAVTVLTMVVFRLPLAWFLLNHYGTTGGWWAMSLSTILAGVLMVWLFRQGKWRTIKV